MQRMISVIRKIYLQVIISKTWNIIRMILDTLDMKNRISLSVYLELEVLFKLK